MTLSQIYAEFTPGSLGFAIAVRTHCGFGMSLKEIKRLGAAAKSWEDFKDQWENTEWWQDSQNSRD